MKVKGFVLRYTTLTITRSLSDYQIFDTNLNLCGEFHAEAVCSYEIWSFYSLISTSGSLSDTFWLFRTFVLHYDLGGFLAQNCGLMVFLS